VRIILVATKNLSTLRPPDVEPAHPQIKEQKRRINIANEVQVLQSTVANPEVVKNDTVWNNPERSESHRVG
jgi:hypothetical protein